jgi:undecaprenyl-diphosphatase
MMDAIQAIILGLLQGLTEFIPVSSSGHLVIGQYFFSGSSDHLFLEWVNIGTFFALLIYFRRRIIAIIRDVLVLRKYRMALNIFITAIPAGLVGFFGSDFIASTYFFNSVLTVICALALVGGLMIVLDRLPKASLVDDGEKLSPLRALVVGILQIFALIPGVSRSGSTIIASRLMGLSSEKAAEYSFLASLPIMFGVTLKLLLGSGERDYLMTHLEPVILGNLAAFLSGVLAVGFLMRYLSTHSLAVFGWYRVSLAAVVALVLLVQ